jgi:hypothetical protein
MNGHRRREDVTVASLPTVITVHLAEQGKFTLDIFCLKIGHATVDEASITIFVVSVVSSSHVTDNSFENLFTQQVKAKLCYAMCLSY